MFARPSRRRAVSLLLPVAVMAGLASPVSSAMAASRPARSAPARAVHLARPGAFGAAVVKSGDLAINGWGDSAGYHLDVGRAAAGYAWREIATLAPAGYDASSWTLRPVQSIRSWPALHSSNTRPAAVPAMWPF